jgi:hypothetical protein
MDGVALRVGTGGLLEPIFVQGASDATRLAKRKRVFSAAGLNLDWLIGLIAADEALDG